MPKYCSNCGAELNEGAVVCVQCGHAIPRTFVKDTRGMVDLYRLAIVRYANFSGRASVREYWMFTLFNIVFAFAWVFTGIFLVNIAGSDNYPLFFFLVFISFLYGLFLVIPSIAISVRRLHDQNKSGAWYFINWVPVLGGIIFLFLMITAGDYTENQYGMPYQG